MMKKTYSTSQIASIVGVHANTVRLYEGWGFISKPKRKENGYRIFCDLHIKQIQILKLLFQVPIVQNGMRKKAVKIIEMVALQDYHQAIRLLIAYQKQLEEEKWQEQEAILIVEKMLQGKNTKEASVQYTRYEAAIHLGITIDRLRNWELNGLIQVKRKVNGYRIYNEEDMKYLKIIRLLRYANYSLMAIMRMLRQFENDKEIDIQETINTPHEKEDIIDVGDRLISALDEAMQTTKKAYEIILKLNPPLRHQT